MFEQNKDFYPTPKEIVEKMIEPYLKEDYYWIKKLQFKNILEPSAWKWDIIDALWDYIDTYREPIYVLEKDLNLQEILKKKKVIFLWDDFLEYNEIKFDLIIMNPPFSNWVDHLLKAWEISKRWTEIVCLLNSETINNPYSEKRKLLLKIIEDNNWSIEDLWACFDNAERKTWVNVSLVRLKNLKAKEEFNFDIDWLDEEKEEFIEEDFVEKWLMWFNKIESIIAEYNEAKELFKEAYKKVDKLQKKMKWLIYFTNKTFSEIIENNRNGQEAFIEFNKILKRWIWGDLIRKSKIEKYMTRKLKSNFDSFVNDQKNIELSEKNIKKFIEFVILNKSNILENAIEEVFDELTKYDKENRYYPEGWKTNDNWKVNKKFILNWIWIRVEKYWTSEYWNFSRWDWWQKLEDIDKVMCYITWKDFAKIRRITDEVDWMVEWKVSWKWGESEFFELKIFKKGSIHLKFKDEFLWKEFNIRACKLKNWLPKWEWEEFTKEKEKKQEQENILKLN